VSRAAVVRLLAACALALSLLAGCGPETSPVVDPALVAFLSKARAAHHRADLAEQEGDRAAAIAAVSTIVDGPRPPATPELVEVLADALARRADLRSQAGDLDGADADVDAGLALATATTHFRGHLLEVRGLVAERRAERLAAAGDAAGAAAARERAIRAFEAAIDVQDEVIRGALEDVGPR
jgi:hypothetical protein